MDRWCSSLLVSPFKALRIHTCFRQLAIWPVEWVRIEEIVFLEA